MCQSHPHIPPPHLCPGHKKSARSFCALKTIRAPAIKTMGTDGLKGIKGTSTFFVTRAEMWWWNVRV